MGEITDLLDDIDRLDQEATPGPWEVWQQMDDDGATYPEYIAGPKNDLFGARGFDDTHYIQEIPELTMDDAEFIALSREAMPRLAKLARNMLELAHNAETQVDVVDASNAQGITKKSILTEVSRNINNAITDAMNGDDDAIGGSDENLS